MQVRFWDGDRLEQVKVHSVPWTVESASYCPAKGRFVAGGEDMWVHLYDYDSGAELECNKGKRGLPVLLLCSTLREAAALHRGK